MKTRSICALEHEARGLRDGSVTVLIRPVKERIVSNGYIRNGDILCHNDYLPPSEMLMLVSDRLGQYHLARSEGWEHRCPFGPPGTRLAVREAWAVGRVFDLTRAGEIPATCSDGLPVWYAADWNAEESWANRGRWRPSIHMPRWAIRTHVTVASVRVMRCVEIGEAEAKAWSSIPVTARDCPPGQVRPLVQLTGNPYLDMIKRMPREDELYRCAAACAWAKHFKRHPFASSWAWVVEVEQ